MEKIIKGDYIVDIVKGTKHCVDSIEVIDNQTIIFTEDSKCFPVEKIKKSHRSSIGNYFYKIFNKEPITIEEEENAILNMKELNLVYVVKK